MLRFDGFGADHSEAARDTSNFVATLDCVGLDDGRGLDEFPDGVFAGSG